MPEDPAQAVVWGGFESSGAWSSPPSAPGGEAVRRLVEANRADAEPATLVCARSSQRLRALETIQSLSEAEIRALQRRVAEFEASTSWRLTAPLRWTGRLLGRGSGASGRAADGIAHAAPARPTGSGERPLSYEEWIATVEPRRLADLAGAELAGAPASLGLILLATDPPPASAAGLIAELAADAAEAGWPLLLLCDAATARSDGLAALAPRPGLLVQSVPDRPGTAQAWALALERLEARMIGVLDLRHRLAPRAMRIVRAALARDPQLDMIFADEDRLDAAGRRIEPFFKPGWDPELAQGRDLFGPFTFHRADLLRAVLADHVAAPLSQTALSRQVAALARPERIGHIPAVLCHRGDAPWTEDVDRAPCPLPDPPPSACLVVLAADAPSLQAAEALLRDTDYPALSLVIATPAHAASMRSDDPRLRVLSLPGASAPALVNAAASATRAELVVLLHETVRPLRADWLRVLAAQVLRPGVAAAGAKLLAPDGRIRSAGLTPDISGEPRHLLRGTPDTDGRGSFGLLGFARGVWAASLACVAVQRTVLLEMGGLNEALPHGGADIDLCLRLAAHDHRTVWTPLAVLEQRAPDVPFPREARDRLVRDWGRLALHDPYLNANLEMVGEQPQLRRPPSAATGPHRTADNAAALPAAPAESAPDPRVVAQARRDRERLVRAQAEIAALREQEASARSMRGVARHAFRLLPQPLRGAVRRVLRPGAPPLTGVSGTLTTPVIKRGTRGVALVIDDAWPRIDRDSGSIDIDNLLVALRALGFDVIFAAARELARPSDARDRLAGRGIQCVTDTDAASVEDFLIRHGARIDLCVLCRAFCGGGYLAAAQRHCGKARLIFNTIDLTFLREQRRALLTGDAALADIARQVRQREEEIIRACDATLVVSTAELELLAESIPDAFVVQMPLARPIYPPRTPFAARHGMGFIGGFAHAPNIDAVRSFLAETWPLVLRHLPDCTFSIVGADFPAELLQGVAAPLQVRALGHVPDTSSWFESLRLTVAPLRYGAGAKGKVASSLAAGVPCVASPVATEGMQLQDGSGVLVGATPEAFAARIRDIHADPALWHALSEGALAYAHRTLSLDAWQDRLDGALQRLGL